MSLRTSANRYARALFDVALEEKADLAQVNRDLQSVVEMMQASPEFAAASNRGLTDATRKSMIEAVARAMSLTTPVTKLVVLLGQDRKLGYLPDLAAAFRERLLAHQNVVRAEVTSAAPLTAQQTTALEASLSKVTGKTVELSASVDPELLGGVVARIGSTVYDGSVRTQLQQMRQELVKS